MEENVIIITAQLYCVWHSPLSEIYDIPQEGFMSVLKHLPVVVIIGIFIAYYRLQLILRRSWSNRSPLHTGHLYYQQYDWSCNQSLET
jgi:hypothetical protein